MTCFRSYKLTKDTIFLEILLLIRYHFILKMKFNFFYCEYATFSILLHLTEYKLLVINSCSMRVRFFSLLIISYFIFIGCFGYGGNDEEDIYTSPYEAIIMTRTDFENAVQTLPSTTIINSGKIYIFENLLFINEVNKGFHVFNYANPQTPLPICFLNVPGATDVSIRDGFLYINQAVDLLTLQYNYSTQGFDFIYRNQNVFPPKTAPDGYYPSINPNEIVTNYTIN